MHRAITLCLVLLAACTPEELPYPWFEREWVSDRDSTFAANPELNEQTLEEREAILSKYGELRWLVEGYNLEAIYPNEPRFNLASRFSIEAIDESSFVLLTETGTTLTILRNQNGFCATPENANETKECFVPYDS